MSEPLVVFDNVERRYGDVVAVRAMNFAIHRGEFLAIMGPSGCGKTITLRMLAGLERPDEGEIRLAGKTINDLPVHERDTPLVWQSLALFPFLNLRENVEFGLKMRSLDAAARRAKAADWLDRLVIAEFAARNIAQLSGGQRQRVALALVTEPQIRLLDEFLSALDAHLVIRMQQVLTKLQRDLGITFVYVTHSQSEAFAIADRVAIMGHGEIAQIGAARDIYRNPANRYLAEFVGRNNSVTGRVEKNARGRASIAGPAGRFTVEVPQDAALAADDTASFAIAADLVHLSATVPRAENVVACSLISEESIGSMVTLFLETADGIEFKVQSQERELLGIDLREARNLYLAWPAASAHLLQPTGNPKGSAA
jgi:spermidine/putrescine transport system ATP-binding protein